MQIKKHHYGVADTPPDLPALSASPTVHERRRRGRGATSNQSGRFERVTVEDVDDGWGTLEGLAPFKTTVQLEPARTIISHNQSPDLPFSQSINPYRGCEHGCSYCYARPTHCYLGHSAGLDFESRLYAKPEAHLLLARELAKPRYKPKVIALGTNTDPYQPIEQRYRITRRLLETFERTSHPVMIVTKSALVLRDIDIMGALAARDLVQVTLSVTTLQRRLARLMEPRASTPTLRLQALARLSEAGIPTGVLVAPVIPALNDMELEQILERCREAGISQASYTLLRLPLEVKDIFYSWLHEHYPQKAEHVTSLLRATQGGRDYDSSFARRRSGSGVYADLLRQRFRLALQRLGLKERNITLRTDLFRRPIPPDGQMQLL